MYQVEHYVNTVVNVHQRWAAQHIFQVRNTQFHSFVIAVRKTQLRSVSKFVSALCAMPQLRILPLRAFMDVTFCLTRSGATKEACIIQCGVMQQRFRGNRSTYHIHYTVYCYSSLSHPPPPPLKIANQHPWQCQPPPPRPPPHGSRCSLSLLLP